MYSGTSLSLLPLLLTTVALDQKANHLILFKKKRKPPSRFHRVFRFILGIKDVIQYCKFQFSAYRLGNIEV
jgi:hypothetical protein